MEICDLCGKKEEYDNCIWYSEEQFNLCKEHHREWLKEHKPYVKTHKDINPQKTKKYPKMCEEEERLFKIWFKQKQTDIKNKE